jgi:uncharacterized protein (TIGR01777 family)
MSERKVVLAGGSGRIGGALAAALAAAGYEVVVLSRAPRVGAEAAPGVRRVGWDGRTAGTWVAELGGARAVVNLAGADIAGGRWTAARKRLLLDSRLEPTAALVEGLRRAGGERPALIQASAVGFYGDRGDEPLDEDSPPGSGFLSETCVAWEQASEPAEALGARRVLLRTGLVLAADGGALPAMARPFRLGVGGPVGGGRQWMPWIHLADEVGAIQFLIESDAARGPFNLVAPAPRTNAEFSRALARALHRPGLLRVPRVALRLALGEMADLLLGGQRAAPRRLIAGGCRFRYPELGPALADLLGRAASPPWFPRRR